MQPVSVVAWDLQKGFFIVHTAQQVLPLRFRRTQDQHPTFVQAQNNCILFICLVVLSRSSARGEWLSGS